MINVKDPVIENINIVAECFAKSTDNYIFGLVALYDEKIWLVGRTELTPTYKIHIECDIQQENPCVKLDAMVVAHLRPDGKLIEKNTLLKCIEKHLAREYKKSNMRL